MYKTMDVMRFLHLKKWIQKVFSAGYCIMLWPLVLVLFATSIHAATPYTPVHPDPALEPWRWTTYPELRGKGLHCLVEDHDGNMWFGLDAGAMRYDGVTWTLFTLDDGLSTPGIYSLIVAEDGTLYAGGSWQRSDEDIYSHHYGIDRYRNGKWERYFPPEGDLDWSISSLRLGSHGSIWAGTAWGALHLQGDKATLYTSQDCAKSLQNLAPYVFFYCT